MDDPDVYDPDVDYQYVAEEHPGRPTTDHTVLLIRIENEIRQLKAMVSELLTRLQNTENTAAADHAADQVRIAVLKSLVHSLLQVRTET